MPGIESVGLIDELGSGTDGLTVGQRIITIGVTGTWQEAEAPGHGGKPLLMFEP